MMDLFIEGFDIENYTNNGFYVILIFIGFDILTGLLVGARERALNSSINFEGLIRKFGLVVAVAFITIVDVYLQVDGKIIGMGIIAIIIYEGLSIIENLSKIGVDIKFLTKYFDPNKIGKGK